MCASEPAPRDPAKFVFNSSELQVVVAAWQAGAISKDTMFELFRRGEILPDGRTNQDEAALIGKLQTPTSNIQGNSKTQAPKV
ncbi:MAG: hypothetical protein QOJ40_1255 [Verrucomicrobiota bacterium]